MLTLGIETSCDETAAAVVKDGKEILSNCVYSQVDIHRRFGGVVPEIAARSHIEVIGPILSSALADARISWRDIELVAITNGPGLVGSLLVGLSAGKAIAYARGIPMVGVNHLFAHWSSVFLIGEEINFPFVSLVVSGGHTSLFLCRAIDEVVLLGQTLDDAAGEALDKAAKLLGLGYPGGVAMDALARRGDPKAFSFPRAIREGLNFSFSGLKTALINLVKKMGVIDEAELPHLSASYLEAIVDVLCEKSLRAAGEAGVDKIVLCGGVAANSRLRERLRADAEDKGLQVFIPPAFLCTDNAAMVAAAGYLLFRAGKRDNLAINAFSRLPV
ncbi:MAG TPA: tRNA (adenosine(37)-N6)-threonylcarbamoyltransferase complex transferase subunit TsaD [Syntrophales bacterium]|nr:tRNA (adenosine(37)-N6)-threonylcarbamoyltransferase complex transferase subunit TsaD [Syntrophales bacterium]HOL59256.1 tRNA (adenosine(37)-N6)-threonylcarbamoyltransferase complex transferase subunit TsaD [Syntrophales bacterium]HPO35306.1 tRNA (adenosine(37)-N6)-threonylcarbamoyltransferase complex transferase subunit TsaD [Syntrophales bacterium]